MQQFIKINDIDMIMLSHLHHDHISDMHILRYGLEGLKARGLALKLPLPVYMPDMPENIAALVQSASVFEVRSVNENTKIKFAGLDITFCAMTHPVTSYAMRFEANGKSFVYSGDTNMNDAIVPFAKEADILLMDAGLLSRDKKDNNAPHVSALEAGLIAARAGVKRLIGTHLFPLYVEGEIMNELSLHCRHTEVAQENNTYMI